MRIDVCMYVNVYICYICAIFGWMRVFVYICVYTYVCAFTCVFGRAEHASCPTLADVILWAPPVMFHI